jgi:hypothetical protein
MHRSGVRHALRLGVVLALVALAVGACGTPEEAKPRPLPENPQALSPGKYRSEEFEPSVSFRIGEGWSHELEASDDLHLSRRGMGGLFFQRIEEVYEPTKAGTPKVVDAPDDFIGWLRQHPYLRTTELELVEVGGVEGKQLDVEAADLPEDYYGVCGADCVDIWKSSSGLVRSHGEENRARVTVLEDVEGETVTLGYGSRTTDFDEYAPEAQKVVDSVKWSDS